MSGFDTARLHLRPIGQGDKALYCHLYTDPDLMRHIAAPMTLEAARRSFDAVCLQGSSEKQRWILLERSGTVPTGIGLLGLFVDAEAMDGRSAEIGVMLLDGWQMRGYAAEAIMAIAGRVFASGALDRLWTRHAPDNALALGLMRKLRFQHGHMDEAESPHTRWSLSRSQWLRGAGQERGCG